MSVSYKWLFNIYRITNKIQILFEAVCLKLFFLIGVKYTVRSPFFKQIK
jgi:hypothetical protein